MVLGCLGWYLVALVGTWLVPLVGRLDLLPSLVLTLFARPRCRLKSDWQWLAHVTRAGKSGARLLHDSCTTPAEDLSQASAAQKEELKKEGTRNHFGLVSLAPCRASLPELPPSLMAHHDGKWFRNFSLSWYQVCSFVVCKVDCRSLQSPDSRPIAAFPSVNFTGYHRK